MTADPYAMPQHTLDELLADQDRRIVAALTSWPAIVAGQADTDECGTVPIEQVLAEVERGAA